MQIWKKVHPLFLKKCQRPDDKEFPNLKAQKPILLVHEMDPRLRLGMNLALVFLTEIAPPGLLMKFINTSG